MNEGQVNHLSILIRSTSSEKGDRAALLKAMLHGYGYANHDGETRYVAPQFHETYPLTFASHPLKMTLLRCNQDHQRTLFGPSYDVSLSAQFQGH